jgi:hypothetical protein
MILSPSSLAKVSTGFSINGVLASE